MCPKTSSPSRSRLGGGLCDSALYRDLLQGVCGKGAGPVAPPIPPGHPEVEVEEEKREIIAATGAPLAVDSGGEWIKNFASPQCGAKLGMMQLLLPVLYRMVPVRTIPTYLPTGGTVPVP